MKKKRVDHSSTASSQKLANPFAALENLRGEVPELELTDDVVEELPIVSSQGKIVVRHERKGHGGKTVTLLERVVEPDELLVRMKRELGVGGKIVDESIQIQGDQRQRVSEWLSKNGFTI